MDVNVKVSFDDEAQKVLEKLASAIAGASGAATEVGNTATKKETAAAGKKPAGTKGKGTTRGKKAAGGGKKKEDNIPANCTGATIKKELIVPLRNETFGGDKDTFIAYIDEHIRPMLQEEFDADSFQQVSPDMIGACYVRTREIIAETAEGYEPASDEEDEVDV